MASGRPSSLGAQALPRRLPPLDHSVAGWGFSPSPLRWEGQQEARQVPGSLTVPLPARGGSSQSKHASAPLSGLQEVWGWRRAGPRVAWEGVLLSSWKTGRLQALLQPQAVRIATRMAGVLPKALQLRAPVPPVCPSRLGWLRLWAELRQRSDEPL